MILGFLLTVCLIPGIIGAGTSSRWALAAVLVPVLVPLSESRWRFTTSHLFGLLFIWYATISLSWSAGRYEGIDALVKLVVIACAFVYGSKLESLKPVIIGFGLGIWVNSLVLMLGIDLTSSGPGAGLFVNSNSMGEIAGLVLVAVVFCGSANDSRDSDGRGATGILRSAGSGWRGISGARRDVRRQLWWLIPGILPAFIMANCRGAFVAVAAAGIWWVWRRHKIAAVTLVACALPALYVLGGGSVSVNMRVSMWADVLPRLTIMGHGLGSFYTLFPLDAAMDTLKERPEHLHNDWLEYAFEMGIGAVPLFCLLWLTRSIVLLALIVEASFGFPTHMAATAILGGIVAGHDTRHRASLRDDLNAWRVSLRHGYEAVRRRLGHRALAAS